MPNSPLIVGTFRIESFAHHLLALILLLAALIVRWPAETVGVAWRGDEAIYVTAMLAVQRGHSPYKGRDSAYLYPPTLAVVGAWAIDRVGSPTVVALIRIANLVGAVTMVWLAACWLPWSWFERIVVAGAVTVLAPGIAFGLKYGNLSLAIGGSVVAGLSLWPRWPATAGFLLGLSAPIKPLAPSALVALVAHRPTSAGKRHLLAGGLGLGLAALVTLSSPLLRDFLTLAAGRPWNGHNVSLHRVLWSFGVGLNAVTLAGLVAILTAIWVRRRPRRPAELLAIASATTLWAVPLVWTHTLLLTLPLQALAFSTAFARRHQDQHLEGLASRLGFYRLLAVCLAIASVHLCGAIAVIPLDLRLVRGFAAAVPALAPLLLALCVTQPRGTASGSRNL